MVVIWWTQNYPYCALEMAFAAVSRSIFIYERIIIWFWCWNSCHYRTIEGSAQMETQYVVTISMYIKWLRKQNEKKKIILNLILCFRTWFCLLKIFHRFVFEINKRKMLCFFFVCLCYFSSKCGVCLWEQKKKEEGNKQNTQHCWIVCLKCIEGEIEQQIALLFW